MPLRKEISKCLNKFFLKKIVKEKVENEINFSQIVCSREKHEKVSHQTCSKGSISVKTMLNV